MIERDAVEGVAALAALLGQARHVVALTGAGISTESGIPDFRSPGGVWSRHDPRDLTFERYVADAGVRARTWEMRQEFFATRAVPNPAHEALAALERAGRLRAVVTQNIDGLHQDAGSSEVVEVHGTARTVTCIGRWPVDGLPDGCGFVAPYAWAVERLESGDPDPCCPDCGGLVKSATVSFGQQLPEQAVRRAQLHAAVSDLFLVVGSSLQVYPAAALPGVAHQGGARVVIVNDEPTDLDPIADLVVRGRAGEVLPEAVARVLPDDFG